MVVQYSSTEKWNKVPYSVSKRCNTNVLHWSWIPYNKNYCYKNWYKAFYQTTLIKRRSKIYSIKQIHKQVDTTEYSLDPQ